MSLGAANSSPLPSLSPRGRSPFGQDPRGAGPSSESHRRPYPMVPLNLDAVDEQVAQGLTVRSLTGIVTALGAGLLLWHVMEATGVSIRIMVAAPSAALGWSAWNVQWGGASLPVWSQRIARYLFSPHLYAPIAVATQSRLGRCRPDAIRHSLR